MSHNTARIESMLVALNEVRFSVSVLGKIEELAALRRDAHSFFGMLTKYQIASSFDFTSLIYVTTEGELESLINYLIFMLGMADSGNRIFMYKVVCSKLGLPENYFEKMLGKGEKWSDTFKSANNMVITKILNEGFKWEAGWGYERKVVEW